MKWLSAFLRFGCGGVLIALPALKYWAIRDDLAQGRSAQLFNHSVSPAQITLILIGSAAVGLVFIGLGAAAIRKRE